jgi:hypothetical protein
MSLVFICGLWLLSFSFKNMVVFMCHVCFFVCHCRCHVLSFGGGHVFSFVCHVVVSARLVPSRLVPSYLVLSRLLSSCFFVLFP